MAITPLTIVLGLAGLVFGLVADRIAARWPAHEEDVVRPVDWRTPVVAGLGAIAMGALPSRFSDPATLSIFVAYFLVLILLLATDLDQRLLPDVITLPLIVAAGAVRLLGLLPPEFGPLWSAVLVAIALPAGLFQGGGTVRLKLTQNARPGDVIAVTVEPAGGTKQPTTTPIAASKA